jgi:hypothetical protein
MDIKITFDITERLENAIKAAGNLLAIVPSLERHENACGMKVALCKAEPAETPRSSEAQEQPKVEKPKKSAKAEPKADDAKPVENKKAEDKKATAPAEKAPAEPKVEQAAPTAESDATPA